jgi:hypothetical protein
LTPKHAHLIISSSKKSPSIIELAHALIAAEPSTGIRFFDAAARSIRLLAVSCFVLRASSDFFMITGFLVFFFLLSTPAPN